MTLSYDGSVAVDKNGLRLVFVPYPMSGGQLRCPEGWPSYCSGCDKAGRRRLGCYVTCRQGYLLPNGSRRSLHGYWKAVETYANVT